MDAASLFVRTPQLLTVFWGVRHSSSTHPSSDFHSTGQGKQHFYAQCVKPKNNASFSFRPGDTHNFNWWYPVSLSGVPAFIDDRELLAHFNRFGKVLRVSRGGHNDVRIYYKDMTGAFQAKQMHEHKLPGGYRLGVIAKSDPLEVERVNPEEVSL